MKEDILHQIGTISRALDSIANIEFKNINLNRGQYLYLVRIKQRPGIFSDELAAMIKVDRTTAARSIQKLEKQGLIYKSADEKNKKIRHLFVTDKGKEIAKFIERENLYSNKKSLSGLSQNEVESLHSMLEIIKKNVTNEWDYVKNGGKRNY